MASSPEPERYGALAQALHWLTAVLVLVAFIYGPGGSEQAIYLPSRDADRQLHESLGLCVFILAFVRLAWRAVAKRPDPPKMPAWLGVAAKAGHGALYVLMFALPITAVSGAWLEGHPLTLLGGLQVAPPVEKSHAFGAWLANLHTWLGDAIMWLAGLHALAALYHHFVLKDGVLRSMLPRRLMKS
ncbi:MAG: cytochrome b [Betaproteobacteria bacterium]|nr:cytochrome b [Betaproteobacteria bacterium]